MPKNKETCEYLKKNQETNFKIVGAGVETMMVGAGMVEALSALDCVSETVLGATVGSAAVVGGIGAGISALGGAAMGLNKIAQKALKCDEPEIKTYPQTVSFESLMLAHQGLQAKLNNKEKDK